MNYYPRHVGDYWRDAHHLSMLEHGAFMCLMDQGVATLLGWSMIVQQSGGISGLTDWTTLVNQTGGDAVLHSPTAKRLNHKSGTPDQQNGEAE